MVNPRVFMDIAVEGTLLGRVIFELFADRVPLTADNFRQLCTGSAGVNSTGEPLWYKGSTFHRVIAGFMVQGGDFTLRNGKGGESIYGGTFADEDLKREIDSEGLLCMANRGKDTNGSQFFISLRPCPHLKGKHVVFGRVVKGFEIVETISKMSVDDKDRPLQLISISHCGELERRAPAKRAPSPSPSRSRSVSVSSSRSRSRSRSPVRDRSRSPVRDRSRSPVRDDRSRSRSLSRSRSRSRSPDRRRHKRSRDERKSRKHKHKSSKRHRRTPPPESSPELTEEQIAALKEQVKREEEEARRQAEDAERLRKQRQKEADELKRQHALKSGDGVVYKGRGRMKAPSTGGMRGWS
ncbi:hypothetical protein ACM66B_006748 [Microbotryomycetes sp. NB124-2]